MRRVIFLISYGLDKICRKVSIAFLSLMLLLVLFLVLGPAPPSARAGQLALLGDLHFCRQRAPDQPRSVGRGRRPV